MIIYSVTIMLDQKDSAEWLEWMLATHIPDVMATGKFMNFHVQQIIYPRQDESTDVSYNIQYECETIKDLEEYQEKYSELLQAEHSERYKDRFVAFRTVLKRII